MTKSPGAILDARSAPDGPATGRRRSTNLIPRAIALLALITFLPLTALAQDDELHEVDLSVKPLLCIVDQRTPACDMAFQVAWQSREAGYYCVMSDLDEQPLRCWAEEREGELEDERSVLEDFSYLINEGEGLPALDAVTVEVVRMSSEDRRRRRRTRHVWDIT